MTMELRSRTSRSRSHTPFVQLTKLDSQQEIITKQNEVIEEEIIVKRAYTTRNSSQRVLRDSSEEIYTTSSSSTTASKPKTDKKYSRSSIKTSDYSSEENETNEAISANGAEIKKNGDVKSALQVYKDAGEYWNKFPKTDYTYSMHSKDRKEIAPGVVQMPNMSRRSLRRSMEPTSTFTGVEKTEHTSSYYDSLLSRRYNYNKNNLRKNLFRDEIDDHHYDEYTKETTSSTTTTTISRKIWTSITRIVTTMLEIILTVYTFATSTVLWAATGYYKFVSRLFLFDTWLMQKTSGDGESAFRRRSGILLALIILPLLLLSGWWLYSGLNHLLLHDGGGGGGSLLSAFLPSSRSNEEHFAKILLPPPPSDAEYNIEEIVKLLLANPGLEEIIVKHMNTKTRTLDDHQDSLDLLKQEVNLVNQKVDNLGSSIRLEMARNNAKYTMELSRCCKRQFVYIEAYVKKLLADLLGLSTVNPQPEDITAWLNAMFVAKQDLEQRLNNLTLNMNADMNLLVESSAAKIMDEVTRKINLKIQEHLQVSRTTGASEQQSALSDSQVHRIVREALALYDADKTGLVDYALESSGGQVLSTRCTENYHARTAVVSVLGIPLWYPSNTPRVVISPGVTPGECWAFQNFPGFLVIKLSSFVKLSAFSLEHIPKSLAPGGHRDSAPKDFTVWGLKIENDREPWLLGSYTYDVNGPALQYFTVENEGPPFDMIELRVESNHGNLNYTCLYRFRVHGNLVDEPT